MAQDQGVDIVFVTTDVLDEADLRKKIGSDQAGAISIFIGKNPKHVPV